MADFGLFVGWGNVVRGRETRALEVFQEAVGFFGNLQQQGEIASVEPVFLEPHGGDLIGFFLLRGERDALNAVRVRDDFERLITRAGMVVESIGVVGASLGERIVQQTTLFQEAAADLGS